MLTYSYINPLIQFGTAKYDLNIMDGETCVFRTQKTFPDTVTEAEMAAYAQARIAAYEASLVPLVPQQVSPRQIRQALTRAGLRDAVEYAVSVIDQDVKDWWEYSTVFERQNPQVIGMAAALGVSDSQVDDLWRLGDSL